MNKEEARQIILDNLQPYRLKPYQELSSMVGTTPASGQIRGRSGAVYQFEIQVVWDDYREGYVRVFGTIDDCPHKPIFWRIPMLRCVPIYTSCVIETFIMSTEGQFVGE
jgi:hypothetical protein